MLFTEELRKCLDAAGLSDCGENDAWNYWYQRVLKAHNEAVERQIATEQVENAKLRELVRDVMPIVCDGCHERLCEMPKEEHPFVTCSFADRMRELGVDA